MRFPHAGTARSLTLVGSAVGTAFLALRRTYRAVDNVITAVENQTVELVQVGGNKSMEFAEAIRNKTVSIAGTAGDKAVEMVEAVGDQGVKAVHLLAAIALTMLCVMLRNLFAKMWYEHKEVMKKQ